MVAPVEAAAAVVVVVVPVEAAVAEEAAVAAELPVVAVAPWAERAEARWVPGAAPMDEVGPTGVCPRSCAFLLEK